MSTNVAIVDDRDPLIQYAGNWNDAGASLEFNSTTRWSDLQGSTASLTFIGTSITVFGTVAAKTSPQASLDFSIDNSSSGTYTPPSNMSSDIHHEPLWVSPPLDDGSHTLVITQTAAESQGEIYLDYIMYNTTSSSVRSHFIDDRDPRIIYTPAWRKFGSEVDFQHTSQGSTSTGDSFVLEFEGKSISFYGGINNGSAGQVLNASMVIDGGTPTYFVPGLQPDADTNNNLIFDSGELLEGNHTLVVTAENDHTVWLDYFLVTPNTETESTKTGSNSSSPSTLMPPVKQSPTKTPIGMIIGILCGALTLLGLGVALGFLCHRRSLRKLQITNNSESAPISNNQYRRASSRRARTRGPASSATHSATISVSTGSGFPASTFTDSSYPASPLARSAAVMVAASGAPLLPSNKLMREIERLNIYSDANRSTYEVDRPPEYSPS
ncbi:hypothetical protein R3P38DRAFT_2961103 [Favolaschia claudopus]|uniref:Transmembrane protein n=1 Tax=Favolaschia claudopus TaxID=2862362 RepID=A0AAW0BC69_9AGAR